MGSIFGTNNQANPQNTPGGGLFGSNTNQPTGGLFGSNTNQSGGGGLFGSTANNNNNNQSGGSGLFGNNTAQASGGGGLFGAGNVHSSGTTGGLFPAQPAAGGSLFGNQNATTTTNNTGSIFGNPPANTSAQNTSIFGTTGAPKNPNASIFNNNTQPQGSLFGTSAAQAPTSQQQAAPFSFMPMASVGQAGYSVPQAQLQSLRASGFSAVPYEKSLVEQIQTLCSKWNVDDEDSLLRTYFYNAVSKSLAPFYYPSATNGETAAGWEEALNNKPELPKISGVDLSDLSYVPILCRGFRDLGERITYQATTVKEMQVRLHEMNNSLSAVMNKHQQDLTVRIASTKKQHQVLSQRCLRLAAKVQVLRNRGYMLDAAEENLRKTLLSLQSQVMDPGFAGREDEIWARMVALRERVRWLEEEGKKVAAQLDAQAESGQSQAVPEEVLLKTHKILKDYDDQLRHLGKELEDVKREYGDYEATQRR